MVRTTLPVALREQRVHGVGAFSSRKRMEMRFQLVLRIPSELPCSLRASTVHARQCRRRCRARRSSGNKIGRQSRNAPGRAATQQAAYRNAADRLVEARAHRVVDDVRAAAAGRSFDLVAHLVLGVVHKHRGAVLPADLHLLVRADGGDHFQPSAPSSTAVSSTRPTRRSPAKSLRLVAASPLQRAKSQVAVNAAPSS